MSLTVEKFIEKKEREFEKDRKLKKEILIEDNEGELCCVIRDKWIFVRKSDVPQHVVCLERLKVCKSGGENCGTRLKEGSYVYRPGFFVIGKKIKPAINITKMEGELIWEGHAPLVPKEDFQEIVRKATKKGLIKTSFLVPSPF